MGKKIVLWILTILFTAVALLYLTGISALAAFAAAVLLAPIDPWQERVGRYVRGAFKGAVVVALALLVCVTMPLPERDTTADAPPVVSQTGSLPADSVLNKLPGDSTADPTPTPAPADSKSESTGEPSGSGEQEYILNTGTKKFHEPDCGSAAKMKEENKKYYCGTREELIDKGYSPCGNCDP